jgi:GcrA cell cycle regulator
MCQTLTTYLVKRHPNHHFKEGDWPDESILLLVELWHKGYSMSAIGNRVNRSRNAVAGQITKIRKHKLFYLEHRKSGRHPKVEEKPQIASLPKFMDEPMPKPPRVRLKVVVDHPTAVTLQELKESSCHYPLGDPRLSDFRFCGKKIEVQGPYCNEHRKIVYQERVPHRRWS